MLGWKFEGPSAPYFQALDAGYFNEAGLNVTISEGAYSRPPDRTGYSGHVYKLSELGHPMDHTIGQTLPQVDDRRQGKSTRRCRRQDLIGRRLPHRFEAPAGGLPRLPRKVVS